MMRGASWSRVYLFLLLLRALLQDCRDCLCPFEVADMLHMLLWRTIWTDEAWADFKFYTCSTGGVVVASGDGQIKCNNTLDDRLRIAYTQLLPDIRTTLFGAVTRA